MGGIRRVAAETAKPHPLIRDPFAQLFLFHDVAGEGGRSLDFGSNNADHDPGIDGQLRSQQ